MEKKYIKIAGLFFIIGNIIFMLERTFGLISGSIKFYSIKSAILPYISYIIFVCLGYTLILNKKNSMVIVALINLIFNLLDSINLVLTFTSILNYFIYPVLLLLFFLVNNNFHISNYRINLNRNICNKLMVNKYLLLLPQIIHLLYLLIKNIINLKVQYSINDILDLLSYMALVIASFYANKESI